MTDLYEEIGVERDATEAEIRAAYRRKAKQVHPDMGGSEEAFARLSTALTVLTDHRRRQTYDETGEIDDKPDNDLAATFQVIERHISAITNEFLKDWNPINDPRHMDIPALVRSRLETEIRQAKMAMTGGRRVVDFLKDMERRFKRKAADDQPNILARGFRQQVEQNERQLATLEHSIRIHEAAIELLSQYSFEKDAQQLMINVMAGSAGGSTTMSWGIGRAGT